MKNNKKAVILICIILVVIVSILGVAYALYEHYAETSGRQLIAGDIYMTLIDGEEELGSNLVAPLTPEEAREEDDNYFTFTVTGSNNATKDIYYEVILTYGNDIANKVRLNDNDIKFDLVELDQDNEDAEITPYLVDAKSYVSLDNQRMYAFKIDAGDTSYSKKFKVRMWISTDILISDTDENRTYCATDNCVEGEVGFGKHYASIKIAIKGGHGELKAPQSLYKKIKSLATAETPASYIGKYSDVITSNPTYVSQDTVKTNTNKQAIYYYTGANASAHANVLFGGYCWQIVRTTDDGGVKLIYNGPALNNTCVTGRTPAKQINGTANQNDNANKNFKNQTFSYADSFSYNEETGYFVLNDYYSATWNDANYKDLVGTYTCMGSYSCQTLYYVGHRQENGEPSYVSYVIQNSDNDNRISTIGGSPFNAWYDSPNLIGYMYNGGVVIKSETSTAETMAAVTFGNYVTYANGTYTLQTTHTGIDNGHHYRCSTEDDANATATSCSTVRYYYRMNNNEYNYIRLTSGKTIESEMKEMFNYKEIQSESDVNINHYNSAIKGLLDNWYLQNLSTYANYLDNETVYCNNRNTSNYAGWTKEGNLGLFIIYGGSASDGNLNCPREVDRFSVNNSEAKLTYSIGLLTEPERFLMQNDYAATGRAWWMISPSTIYTNAVTADSVNTSGILDAPAVRSSNAVRPVITLAPGIDFVDGDGGYSSPYVISVHD